VEREIAQQNIVDGIANVEAANTEWKKKLLVCVEQKQELERLLREMTAAHDRHKMIAERQLMMMDSQVEDPRVAQYRARIEELEGNIVEIEKGIQGLIDENTRLSLKTDDVAVLTEDVHAIYVPIVKAFETQIKDMDSAHEELKEILKIEMKRAQDTCRDIEEQVKRFPDPFLDEIQEMKDKYAQMQAGMLKIQVENLYITETAEKMQIAQEKEIVSLEKSLKVAKDLLHEVSTLEALKHLKDSDAVVDEFGIF